MNLFIEKLVLQFGRNRSRNNEVITISNIWWKNGECYFWPPEPQIFGFVGFSKMDLVVHDDRNRMAFTPLKSALGTVLEISWGGGAESAPPHQRPPESPPVIGLTAIEIFYKNT